MPGANRAAVRFDDGMLFAKEIMRRDLEGKVVVVTGGLGALGIAAASGAALRGARVVLIDRAGGSTGALPACLDGCPVLYGVDLTVLAAASDAMSTVANDTGGIDALVKCSRRLQMGDAGRR
jgi:NAD(P)-dependent dehydrogenase (short-subunit alcohol dehydrogenase family)